MRSIYHAGEIDRFENLDIVHIRLLVDGSRVGSDKGLSLQRNKVLSLCPNLLEVRVVVGKDELLGEAREFFGVDAARDTDRVRYHRFACHLRERDLSVKLKILAPTFLSTCT
jgi:hypothetical protein